MGEMDGLTATSEIRKFNKTVKILISSGGNYDLNEYINFGADGAIEKPITIEKIYELFKWILYIKTNSININKFKYFPNKNVW